MTAPVGIEKIGVYPCTLALPMPVLCEARGRKTADIVGAMMIDERSLNPLWEDPVTMAVNAANSILTDEDRSRVGGHSRRQLIALHRPRNSLGGSSRTSDFRLPT